MSPSSASSALPFANKSVIVTGAAGGLGKAIAQAFAAAGANLVVCDVNMTALAATAAELGAQAGGGAILTHETDVSNAAHVAATVQLAVSTFGALDILVNNAAVMDKCEPVGTVARATWDRVLAINLTGTYLFTDEAVKAMLGHGGGGGVIVNIASAAGVKGGTAGAAYTASKHGVLGLTKNTAAFLGKKGIRCNAVMPGPMQTGIGAALAGAREEDMGVLMSGLAMQPPMSELGAVARVVLFLCGEGGSAVNGACVPVDGGWTAY